MAWAVLAKCVISGWVLAAWVVACRPAAQLAPLPFDPNESSPVAAPPAAAVAPGISAAVAAPPPSLDAARATQYLVARSEAWIADTPERGNNFACSTTCHTGLPLALARAGTAGAPGPLPFHGPVRTRVTAAPRWDAATPFYGSSHSKTGRQSLGSEAILNAAILMAAAPDARRRDAETERALEHLLAVQRSDGGFDWLDFRLEPWESGDEVLGASLAGRALAPVAADPSFAAAAGSLARFPRMRLAGSVRPFSLAFALWAARDLPGVMSPEQRREAAQSIARLLREDGGLSWADAGIGSRTESDPLPTAVALFALCSVDANEQAVAQAVHQARAFLVAHQAPDGSLASRSPNRDKPLHHVVSTDAATGYALIAFRECARSPLR